MKGIYKILMLIPLCLSATLMGSEDHGCPHKEKSKCIGKERCKRSLAAPMMIGNTPNTNRGWDTLSLVTVGEKWKRGFTFNQDHFKYNPIGTFDGIGVFPLSDGQLRAFINHEIPAAFGLAYSLLNHTVLTGARVDAWDFKTKKWCVEKGHVAFDTILDREGDIVTDPQQLNKGREAGAAAATSVGAGFFYNGGFTLFCSGGTLGPKKGGFPNDLYFAGEEFYQGQGTVINPCSRTSYSVPMLGQHNFENAIPMANYNTNKVALLIGDDDELNFSPLWLYVGELGARPPVSAAYQPPSFLVKNGLGYGRLYAWVADNPNYVDESDFFGTGNAASGRFVFVKQYDPSQEGIPPYDSLGFLPNTSFIDAFFTHQLGALVQLAFNEGAFRFIRPEDLSSDPHDRTQAVFSSTGAPRSFNAEGRLYILDFDSTVADVFQQPIECIEEFKASLRILYDSQDAGGGQFATPEDGIRSPDNVDWGTNGYIYVQEDLNSQDFCSNGIPPSMWEINPYTSGAIRILELDRNAVPKGQIDVAPNDCDAWESSGVLDISQFVCNPENRTFLLFDVQAHSIIGSTPPGLFDLDNLVEGAQWLVAIGPKHSAKNTLCNICKRKQKPFAEREIFECPGVEEPQSARLASPSFLNLTAEERARIYLRRFIRDSKEADKIVQSIIEQAEQSDVLPPVE